MKSERMIDTDIKLLLYDIQTYCNKWKGESKLAKETLQDVNELIDRIGGVRGNAVVQK